MDKVTIFDTTLRDGEQSPGFSMTAPQKMRMARMLAALKVDVIEAGFPAASPDDFNSVRNIARAVKGPTICGLARCNDHDISRAAEALKPAGRSRLHVFIATSPIHRKHKLKMNRAQVLARARSSVELAVTLADEVEFSAEDAIRTEREYLTEVLAAAIEAGATTVNIPDTVGYTTPAEMADLIGYLVEEVPNIDRAVISTHCHDDLGMAVANSLAAIRAGARQIECTINGIGERAGNASLEEVVMALKTRAELFQCQTTVDTRKLHPASRLLAGITGSFVPPNKAIVGDNAFAHEAGIHQHGVLANAATYEIMRPEDVGIQRSQLVLGKHSGRHAVANRYRQLGFELDEDELSRVFDSFKELADRKKRIFDADLEALVAGAAVEEGPWQIRTMHVATGVGEREPPSATVTLAHGDGTVRSEAAVGDGPLDAAFKAVIRATGLELSVSGLAVRSVTAGEDAQGEAEVRALWRGEEFKGHGVSTDIVAASTQALMEIVNRVARRLDRASAADKPQARAALR